jgi:hypothetical protein
MPMQNIATANQHQLATYALAEHGVTLNRNQTAPHLRDIVQQLDDNKRARLAAAEARRRHDFWAQPEDLTYLGLPGNQLGRATQLRDVYQQQWALIQPYDAPVNPAARGTIAVGPAAQIHQTRDEIIAAMAAAADEFARVTRPMLEPAPQLTGAEIIDRARRALYEQLMAPGPAMWLNPERMAGRQEMEVQPWRVWQFDWHAEGDVVDAEFDQPDPPAPPFTGFRVFVLAEWIDRDLRINGSRIAWLDDDGDARYAPGVSVRTHAHDIVRADNDQVRLCAGAEIEIRGMKLSPFELTRSRRRRCIRIDEYIDGVLIPEPIKNGHPAGDQLQLPIENDGEFRL